MLSLNVTALVGEEHQQGRSREVPVDEEQSREVIPWMDFEMYF